MEEIDDIKRNLKSEIAKDRKLGIIIYIYDYNIILIIIIYI